MQADVLVRIRSREVEQSRHGRLRAKPRQGLDGIAADLASPPPSVQGEFISPAKPSQAPAENLEVYGDEVHGRLGLGMDTRSTEAACYGSSAMRTVTEGDRISLEELRSLAAGRFGELVKAVVDLERRIMIVDAELHADQEAELLAGHSRQQDLWGINLYPDLTGSDWLEFDSMINLRPSFGNRSRGVDDPAIRNRIADLVRDLVIR